MPVEPVELIKLIVGIGIITIPGYLWSFFFSTSLTRTERVAFGFIVGIGFLTVVPFMINAIFSTKITQNVIIILCAIYAIPILILYGLSLRLTGLPKVNFKGIKNKKYLLLLIILGFSFFMIFLPHLSNNYYLPFHVDEWIHWSYSSATIESGSTVFPNPYTGKSSIASPEIGFHIATSSLYWVSGTSLSTIFLFMPSIIAVFISLIAFNIGNRAERKFGFEAAFFVAFIPTTIRFLGPSFYVPLTLGLLFLIFVIWLMQLQKIQAMILISVVLWCMFLIHPVTAVASIIILFIYAVFSALQKQYLIAVGTSLSVILPLLIIYFLTTRWDIAIKILTGAIYGKEYLQDLPRIWIDFSHLGIIIWILFIIGVYFSFSRGKTLVRVLSFSSIALILIIGVYDRFGYGLPIIYDRTFTYLFLVITLVAGMGFSELRRTITTISEKRVSKNHQRYSKHIGLLFPLIVCVLLLGTVIPAHTGISYYKMINEKEYETFMWIGNNIDEYRDENHSYKTGAIDPFKASPFSAITGLYIISSTMNPTYGYDLQNNMEQFLNDKCNNTKFLNTYKISVVYGECNNKNLTMIHQNVYIYPGLKR